MGEEKEAPKRVSRRQFVKGAAAVAGAGALASCAPAATPAPTAAPAPTCPPAEECAPCPVPGVPETWDKEADVVVVGFGGAGGCAALEAADAGAEVIILEKTATPGGATCLCAGIFYAAGTSVQEEAGITDTPDEMYKYSMAMGKGLADPELVRVWVDNVGETFEWLQSMGAEYYSGVGTPGVIPLVVKDDWDAGYGLYYSGAEADPWAAAITPPKPRGNIVKPVEATWPYPPEHPWAFSPAAGITRGTGFFKPLWEGVKERGSEVLLETSAIALIVDPTKREVLGVKAESGGEELFIKASRAVVLATSGFLSNPEMIKNYNVEDGAAMMLAGTAADTGDGIKMGMAIGADLKNMDQGTLGYDSLPRGAILVNYGGRRFVDETLYRLSGEAIMGQVDSLAYAIFDEEIQQVAQVPETIQAPTIAELAGKIGVDASVLEDTLNTYNGYVESGKDLEFGRTRARHHADPESEGMVPIQTPPFHAVKAAPAFATTHGGLRINTKCQVIDVYDTVIPRLYAAGSTTGAVLGDMYPGSGSAISQAFVFGRIAGQNAGAEEPWE